jgi:hypothetical protein
MVSLKCAKSLVQHVVFPGVCGLQHLCGGPFGILDLQVLSDFNIKVEDIRGDYEDESYKWGSTLYKVGYCHLATCRAEFSSIQKTAGA